MIFFLTRHDWVDGKGYNDKANDELLKAVGSLRRSGHRIGVLFCDWGHNQDESRSLVADLGYTENTKWLAPQATKRFMVLCSACDIVADQFKLGSFGGILFKAMATGTAILTYLNENDLLKMYPEVPPVINGRNAGELEAGLKRVLEDRALLLQLGRGGRDWIERYHSGEVTIRRQMEQYEKFLAGRQTTHTSNENAENSRKYKA